jgi:hypothetical protein
MWLVTTLKMIEVGVGSASCCPKYFSDVAKDRDLPR